MILTMHPALADVRYAIGQLRRHSIGRALDALERVEATLVAESQSYGGYDGPDSPECECCRRVIETGRFCVTCISAPAIAVPLGVECPSQGAVPLAEIVPDFLPGFGQPGLDGHDAEGWKLQHGASIGAHIG